MAPHTELTLVSGYQDRSDRSRLFAAIVMGVVGPEVFIVQPGFVQGIVKYLGFDERSAGYAASIEVWGITATTVLLGFVSQRLNWRRVFTCSLLLVAASNAACIGIHDKTVFLAFRFLAGVGAGSLISLGFTTIGLTSNPDRNFGHLIMWVLIYSAVVLYFMPAAYALAGMNGVLAFFALLPLLALPLVRALPASGEIAEQHQSGAVTLNISAKTMALASMFAYFVAQGMTWAYLFLIGMRGGLAEQQTANSLTLAQICGIGGALLPAVAGQHFGRRLALTLGILGGAFCLIFLVGHFEPVSFAIWVCLYNFLWNMTHPYLLASMASFDRSGRMVVLAVAMQMGGLAVGPALAANILGAGNFANINKIAIAMFLLSWICILPPISVQRNSPTRLATDCRARPQPE